MTPPDASPGDLTAVLDEVRSQHGTTLASLSMACPVLVVCLRHFG